MWFNSLLGCILFPFICFKKVKVACLNGRYPKSDIIDKLEAVQQRATRWIIESDDDYDTRLPKLRLLSLSSRRFTRDVTFFLM